MLRNFIVCPRLSSSSAFLFLPFNTQNRFVKNKDSFLRMYCFINQIPWMYVNSPSMACHNNLITLEASGQNGLFSMVQFLSRFLHDSSSASFMAHLWNPHFWRCHKHGQLNFCVDFRRSSTWILSKHLSGNSTLSLWEYELQWGKSNNPVSRAAILFTQ